ncbi:FAD-binding protein [Shigella flexneri]
MYLDISHKPGRFYSPALPADHRKLLGPGIHLTRDPVPLLPAAHYTCGGVMVDDHGRTDVDGLYAIGEIGLHRPAWGESHGIKLAAGVSGVRVVGCGRYYQTHAYARPTTHVPALG